MANFVFPTPIYLGRRSVMNDLGLGTILGNGSPVSPRWTYYRERAWSDEDDDTGRRGAAPNVEPPPGSPEYQSALLQAHGHVDGAALPAVSIAIPMGSDVGATQAAGAVGSRLAPAASGLAAGAAVLLTPTNTPATTYELGNGLRARSAPGQRSVSIERRVDDGLLGTGVGAKW